MTNEDVRRAQQRIADMRDVRGRELAASAAPPRAPGGRVGAPVAVGDRVLDLRGGREGEVFDVLPADRARSVRVCVRFDDGGTSIGPASDLVARPKPPEARR
jgi:hypothetical protein